MPSDRRLRQGPLLFAMIALLGLLNSSGCKSPNGDTSESAQKPRSSESSEEAGENPASAPEDRFTSARDAMVKQQIAARGVEDPDVLEAMRTVPRHLFVPERYRSRAYSDSPLPIGHNQTISQPYIVAVMTEALQVKSEHQVLEIGTGSGYQAAILSHLVDDVYSIEIICELAERAKKTLSSAGRDNVHVKCGDGYEGWPEHAPFDRIIVTAAPPEIPEALVEQLRVGGRMILPVGDRIQELKIVEKKEGGRVETVEMMKVRFVPMVHGEEE